MDRETNNTSWLSDLEEKVQEAAKRLRELRTENAELRTTVSELEGRLIGAEEAKQAVASWESERYEVQQRVNTLVSHLEELLED
jgi:predicted RNase H-like nuclease (RuvC/YqgF family)